MYNVTITFQVLNSKQLRLNPVNAQLCQNFETILKSLCTKLVNKLDLKHSNVEITYKRDFVNFVKSFGLKLIDVPESDFSGSVPDQKDLTKPAWELIKTLKLSNYLKVYGTSSKEVKKSTSNFKSNFFITYSGNKFKNVELNIKQSSNKTYTFVASIKDQKKSLIISNLSTKSAKELAKASRSKDPQQVIEALKDRGSIGQYICKAIADAYDDIDFTPENPSELNSLFIK